MKKIIILNVMVIVLILVSNMPVYARYCLEQQHLVAKIDIDRTPPNIEIADVTSTNDSFEFEITITDKNLVKNLLNNENIEVKVYSSHVLPRFVYINKIRETESEEVYHLQLNDKFESLSLIFVIEEGTIRDTSNNSNTRFEKEMPLYQNKSL